MSLLFLTTPIKLMLDLWIKLPKTIRVLIIFMFSIFITYAYTNYKAEQRFKAIIKKSNEEAVAVDRKLEAQNKENMERQLAELKQKDLAAQNKLAEYATQYQAVKDACNVDTELLKKEEEISNIFNGKNGKKGKPHK